MKHPKINVIMSVYNGLPYLKEAVGSILHQTYKNFEFIIVDDASNDNSLKYLESLKDTRIKLIKNKKNLGLAVSLNRALKIVIGDYVARMDADDISLPTRFKEQINFLKKNPSIDLCSTWAILIDNKNKKIGKLEYPTSSGEIKRDIVLYNPIVHPSIMAKKSYFKKTS